jgi:hypothetical protein
MEENNTNNNINKNIKNSNSAVLNNAQDSTTNNSNANNSNTHNNSNNTYKNNFFDFNKQILFGEIGSLLGAPLFGFIASLMTTKSNIISGLAVAGSLFGAAVFWLAIRIHDEKRKKKFSVKKMAGDIAYYTPAATPLVFLVYQPVLFFLTKFLLKMGFYSVLSVVLAQFSAFILFLILINVYRIILLKYFKREL